MNPHQQFCHNERCRAYGRCGEDHIVIHIQKERRYRCKRCGRTFTETKDTAFGIDERTVARWQREAGSQCKRAHEHLVETGRVQLLQVSKPTRSGSQGCGWGLLVSFCDGGKEQAMAGFSDQSTARREVDPRAADPGAPLWPRREDLVVTDGLASYASQALKVFRKPLHSGKVGRPRLVLPAGVMVARVIKCYRRRRVVEVLRRVSLRAPRQR